MFSDFFFLQVCEQLLIFCFCFCLPVRNISVVWLSLVLEADFQAQCRHLIFKIGVVWVCWIGHVNQVS